MRTLQMFLGMALVTAMLRVTMYSLPPAGPSDQMVATLPKVNVHESVVTPKMKKSPRDAHGRRMKPPREEPDQSLDMFDGDGGKNWCDEKDECPCQQRDPTTGTVICPCWKHCIYTKDETVMAKDADEVPDLFDEDPVKQECEDKQSCPCPKRDRHGVITCPCWRHCTYSAVHEPETKLQPKLTKEELMQEVHNIVHGDVKDELPRRARSDREHVQESSLDDTQPRLNQEGLKLRLQQGGFILAGKGSNGGLGEEAYTILAAEYMDDDGSTKFTAQHAHVSHAKFEPEIINSLPKTDYAVSGERNHRTCAIVGNSGTLLRSGLGAEIDAHDAVLRINYAPVRGYETDVGRKTTYDFSNRENARRILKANAHWRDSTLLFFEVSSPTNRRQMFVPMVKKFPEKEIHFIHPGFVGRAMDLWSDMKTEVETRMEKKFHDKPMSGFMAVMFMSQVCSKLDIYGFEAYTQKRPNSPYHYFDNVQGVTTVHSFDMAIEMYRLLGEVYPVQLKMVG